MLDVRTEEVEAGVKMLALESLNSPCLYPVPGRPAWPYLSGVPDPALFSFEGGVVKSVEVSSGGSITVQLSSPSWSSELRMSLSVWSVTARRSESSFGILEGLVSIEEDDPDFFSAMLKISATAWASMSSPCDGGLEGIESGVGGRMRFA